MNIFLFTEKFFFLLIEYFFLLIFKRITHKSVKVYFQKKKLQLTACQYQFYQEYLLWNCNRNGLDSFIFSYALLQIVIKHITLKRWQLSIIDFYS